MTGQACAEGDGVTVVVDLSDLGEEVRVAAPRATPPRAATRWSRRASPPPTRCPG
ncbi:hypothetical protein [Georgenia sp. SUBG003]|uniref:hypothetical protein n=1 Tax=Georgenia sp. SUBG003 TaxID=1497974 RepID=UPI003AB58161